MKEYFEIIKRSPLFAGIEEDETEEMFRVLGAYIQSYKKEEFIFRMGEHVHLLGMVLYGDVHIVREDFWGNRNILTEIGPGQIFAETYACLRFEELGVDVVAADKAEVLFLDIYKVTGANGEESRFHNLLVRNLLDVLAGKNLMLTAKMGHIMQRSTREKLLSYLSEQSRKAHSPEFIIPFDRQQMADYLSVDRSAMSKELGKLRKEGIISFDKNKFKLCSSEGGALDFAEKNVIVK